ncbi:Uncharacterised protein [Vibrio cholerae]|uniref:Uncharacterized protein n=1 Tax=Vibrio cholerae TaxID=666 RepID=A0A655S3P2_VIBCL|nr:Uncharacterised protein [Vibrio cholerae]
MSGNKIELVKTSDPDLTIEQHLAIQVLSADTVILLDALVLKYGDDLNTLVEKMSHELGKKWKPASGQRYVRALLRYRNLAKNTIAANMEND